MIISNTHKFVYLDIPKTASSTLDSIFSKYGGKVIPIHSKNTKHNRNIPSYASNYDIIASIRDPYDRLVSHYWFEYGRGRKDTFEEYVDFHLSILDCDDLEIDPNKYRYFPCAKYLKPFDVKHLIRLENIQDDLKCLPFYRERKLMRLHANKHPSFQEMDLSKSLVNKINIWAKMDCELYGYPIR